MYQRTFSIERLPFYRKLDPEVSEIRLIEVLPNEDEATEIRCTTSHTALGSDAAHQKYHALSYEWGESLPKAQILVDGYRVPVTQNLERFLRSFRLGCVEAGKESPRLWIDALCINQDDIIERSQQVQMMKKIYKCADVTFAWLGEADEMSNLAIEFLFDILDKDGEPWHNTTNDSKEFRALISLLSRPYWSRVWIIQELAVSKCVLIQCGPSWFPLNKFLLIARGIRNRLAYLAVVGEIAESARTSLSSLALVDKWIKDGEMELYTLLWMSRLNQATDPRDKVYALLGLARDRDRAAIIPDYSISMDLSTLSLKLINHLVRVDGNLGVFNGQKYDSSAPGILWVFKDPEPAPRDAIMRPFRQSFPVSPRVDPIAPFLGESECLRIQGYITDVISTIEEPYGNFDNFVDVLQNQAHAAEALEHRATSLIQSNIALGIQKDTDEAANSQKSIHDFGQPGVPSQAAYQEAFWRTLISNHERNYSSHDLLLTCPAAPVNGTRYFVWTSRAPIPEDFESSENSSSARWYNFINPYIFALVHNLTGRCFFTAKNGAFGIAPRDARVGDPIAVFSGGDRPFALRRVEDGKYTLLGDAFVYDIVKGKPRIDTMIEQDLREQTLLVLW